LVPYLDNPIIYGNTLIEYYINSLLYYKHIYNADKSKYGHLLIRVITKLNEKIYNIDKSQLMITSHNPSNNVIENLIINFISELDEPIIDIPINYYIKSILFYTQLLNHHNQKYHKLLKKVINKLKEKINLILTP
jgi:hypothetical protein